MRVVANTMEVVNLNKMMKASIGVDTVDIHIGAKYGKFSSTLGL